MLLGNKTDKELERQVKKGLGERLAKVQLSVSQKTKNELVCLDCYCGCNSSVLLPCLNFILLYLVCLHVGDIVCLGIFV